MLVAILTMKMTVTHYLTTCNYTAMNHSHADVELFSGAGAGLCPRVSPVLVTFVTNNGIEIWFIAHQ